MCVFTTRQKQASVDPTSFTLTGFRRKRQVWDSAAREGDVATTELANWHLAKRKHSKSNLFSITVTLVAGNGERQWKIVIAPDSFKESLSTSSSRVLYWAGLLTFSSRREAVKMPLADGGEGTVDVLG